jgi:hypothetical protein
VRGCSAFRVDASPSARLRTAGFPAHIKGTAMTCQVRIQLVSPSVEGALNPAYMEMSFADLSVSGLTVAQLAARFIAFVTNGERTCAHAGVQIAGLDYRASPTGSYLPVPFPIVEYGVVEFDYDDEAHVPGQTSYNSGDIGYSTFTSSGRGDSLCMSYRSNAPGRSSKGRNFFPFLARECITTQGLISDATANLIQAGYDEILNGGGSGSLAESAFPEVYSTKLGTGYPIFSYVVAKVPSRLRSRTK